MTVKLGVTLPQFTGDAEAFEEAALAAEEAKFDSIWTFDHLWPLSGGKQRPILECWSSLAWLAAATERITVGTMVTRSTLRHPVLLAKLVATVGAIAPGRVVVTIGSGDELSRRENEAYGLPYFSGEDRTDQLRSTVDVVTSYLTQNEISLDDDFVTARSLPTSPATTPRPEVWLGGRSDEVIQIAADLADGWNGWGGSPAQFARDARRVSGLTDRSVYLTWAGLVLPAESDAEALARLEKPRGDRIVGGPDTVAAALNGFVESGASHLVLTHVKGWDPDSLRAFARDVRPRIRV